MICRLAWRKAVSKKEPKSHFVNYFTVVYIVYVSSKLWAERQLFICQFDGKTSWERLYHENYQAPRLITPSRNASVVVSRRLSRMKRVTILIGLLRIASGRATKAMLRRA